MRRGSMDKTPYLIEYLLEDARLVAIIGEYGGAVVQDGLRVVCEEGRIYSDSTTSGLTPGGGVLEYHCSFSIEDAAMGDTMVGVPAHIVVSGTLSTGGWIEIRGQGQLDYDEHGNPFGEFADMPRIVVEEGARQVEEPDSSFSADEWIERMKDLEPKTLDEFKRAIAGRQLDQLLEDGD
jgi:hypothetical protein